MPLRVHLSWIRSCDFINLSTSVHIKSPRQLQRVRGNADGGATWQRVGGRSHGERYCFCTLALHVNVWINGDKSPTSAEQSPSWEANNHLGNKETCFLVENRIFITVLTTARHWPLFEENLSKNIMVLWSVILYSMRGSSVWEELAELACQLPLLVSCLGYFSTVKMEECTTNNNNKNNMTADFLPSLSACCVRRYLQRRSGRID